MKFVQFSFVVPGSNPGVGGSSALTGEGVSGFATYLGNIGGLEVYRVTFTEPFSNGHYVAAVDQRAGSGSPHLQSALSKRAADVDVALLAGFTGTPYNVDVSVVGT